MEHMRALVIKFIFTAIVILSIYGIFYNAAISNLLWISLFVTGIAYLIGDLYILPRAGNILATIADFGLVFLSLLFLGNMVTELTVPILVSSFFASFLIAFCESLFHAYMQERVINTRQEIYYSNQFQTEFAEETNEQTVKKDKNKRKKEN